MILNDGKKEIDTNFEKTSSFRIAANSKMFEILSSKLYADPIAAIIRELSTNAVDSHIAANREAIPFSVHMPTLLEPWFSVTDTGIGMNHDEILQIYTEYGNSQKDDSNLYNGALGLGSKSPFGYTQEFTVVSTKDGIRNTYLCYINKGFPDISLISTEETTDHSGVAVQVPVKADDHKRFSKTASRVYSFFKLRPTVNQTLKYAKIEKFTDKVSKVTGMERPEHEEDQHNALLKGFGAHFSRHDYNPHHQRETMYIVQSNVAYPVSEKHAEVIFAVKDKDQTKAEQNFALYDFFRLMLTDPNSAFVLNVENGSVSFTPNREEISLDEGTIETIRTILFEFQEQHLQVIAKDLEPLSYHEFIRKHGHFIHQMSAQGSQRADYTDFLQRHPAYKQSTHTYHGFSFLTDYEFRVRKYDDRHLDYMIVELPWVILHGTPNNGCGVHSTPFTHNTYTSAIANIKQPGNKERASFELTYANNIQASDTYIITTTDIPALLKSADKSDYQAANALMRAIGFDNTHTGKMVLIMEPDYAEKIKANPAFTKVFPKVTYLAEETVREQIKDWKKSLSASIPKKKKAPPRTLEEKILVYRFSRKDGGTVLLSTVKEAADNYAVIGDSKSKYQRFKNMDGSLSFYGWEHYRRIAAFLNQDIFIFTDTSYALALKSKYKFKDLKSDPLDIIKKDLEKPEMLEALYCFEMLFPNIDDKDKLKVAKLQEQTKETKLGEVLKMIVDNWAIAIIVRNSIRTGIFKNPYKGKYTILKGLNIGHGKGVTKDTIALLTLIEKHYIGETNV